MHRQVSGDRSRQLCRWECFASTLQGREAVSLGPQVYLVRKEWNVNKKIRMVQTAQGDEHKEWRFTIIKPESLQSFVGAATGLTTSDMQIV